MTRFTHLVLLKSIFVEFFTAVLRFPIIYYSTGLREVANKALAQILWLEKFFALRLSVNTLFTPLYGDYSKEGRVAGLVVRLALLIFRSLGF